MTAVDEPQVADRGFLLVAGALVAIALVPFLFMGPGTDLDGAR